MRPDFCPLSILHRVAEATASDLAMRKILGDLPHLVRRSWRVILQPNRYVITY